MKKCKNCSEELEEKMVGAELCEDCAEEAEIAAAELGDDDGKDEA